MVQPAAIEVMTEAVSLQTTMVSLFRCCVQERWEDKAKARVKITSQVSIMDTFSKPPGCATARLSGRPVVSIASYSIITIPCSSRFAR
jgi:hypothetical protein